MADLVVAQAYGRVVAAIRSGLSPYLAVLGPDGSGKAQLMGRLALQVNETLTREVVPAQLFLNLSRIQLDTEEEMYRQVLRCLLKEAGECGIVVPDGLRVSSPLRQFETVIVSLLRAIEGRMFLYLEHLDSVPRFFARSLARRFRQIYEQVDNLAEYKRLGLVAAGALSLFELKLEVDSAFAMCEPIVLPPGNIEQRRSLVEERLRLAGVENVDAGTLDLITAETGGEPAFLEPLLAEALMDERSPLFQAATEATLRLSSLESEIPELASTALYLYNNEEVKDLVLRLRDPRQVVRLRDPNADIDRFHLMGAVVVDRSVKPYRYRFRNEMVKRYLLALLDKVPLPGTLPSSLRTKPNESLGTALGASDLPARLESLAWLYTQISKCRTIGEAIDHLQVAWQVLTPQARPSIELQLRDRKQDLSWWLSPDSQAPPLAGKHSGAEATRIAAEMSQDRRPYFGTDQEHVSLGIRFQNREVSLTLVATLFRGELRGEFSESSLRHWIDFAQAHGQGLLVLALAEVGYMALLERGRASSDGQKESLAVEVEEEKPDALLQLMLLQDFGLIWSRAGLTKATKQALQRRDLENLNARCFDLGRYIGNPGDFKLQIQSIADHMFRVLSEEANFELTQGEAYEELLFLTDVEGLKLPLELLPHPYERSNLALRVGLSRRLINLQTKRTSLRSFQRTLDVLKASGKRLRVLLVAADVIGDLPSVVSEVTIIEQIIQRGCTEMGLEAEIVVIKPAFADTHRVEQALREEAPWHIFHFCGHGLHDLSNRDGSGIWLMDVYGQPENVTTERLRYWIEQSGACLVYLSACEGGAVSGFAADLSQRYLGTLEAVVAAGVPTVVGFRWSVSDLGARGLAEQFYLHLFKFRKNPRLAMLEARRSLQTKLECMDAWASSLLITQCE